MWSKIQSMLEGQPERLKVVRIILENGLGLRGSEVYLNDIEIPVVRIAKLAGVDRRTVDETIRMIERNPEFESPIRWALAERGREAARAWCGRNYR